MGLKLIPFPTDASPGTVPTFRELIDRQYAIERTVASNQSEGNAGSKGLGATVQNLSVTVSDLASRYAVIARGDFQINTGSLPPDATFHDFGSVMTVKIVSPGIHKQLVVTLGAGHCIAHGGGASDTVLGEMTFEIPGIVGYGTNVARVSVTRDIEVGVPVIYQSPFRLPAGEYTVNAKCRAWLSAISSATAYVKWSQPYVTAEIIGSETVDQAQTM